MSRIFPITSIESIPDYASRITPQETRKARAMGKIKDKMREDLQHENASQEQATVLEKFISIFATDLLQAEASSLNIEKALEILADEKDKLRKIEAARKEAEAIAQKKWEGERKRKEEAHRREVNQITSMELPLDWENLFHGDQITEDVHAENSADALLLSLSNLGRVDIEYMAEISGSDPKSVILDLKGSIFQNPETWERCWYKGWETKDHYLSGNLMRKRDAAIVASKEFDGYFRDNISAIDSVLPVPLSMEEIYVTLGSPWIPPDIIDDFANHIIGLDHYPAIKGTKHDPITGTWELPYRGRGVVGVERKWRTEYSFEEVIHPAHNVFGTERMAALDILERTLNTRPIKVTDPDPAAPSSSKKRILNEGETLSALEQQRKMVAEFKDWVWEDSTRSERLQMIYENNFGCVKQRRFDGSFLRFPDMNPSVTLHPYQKDAVARMIMTPNTLLAHDVGAGKTYMMIAAGMEMKRMGLSEKNLYVVPNGILAQWSTMFAHIYPASKVLTIEPKDFTPAKRAAALRKMRDGAFDAILIAYSSFSSIKLSHAYELDSLEDELNNTLQLLAATISNQTKSLIKRRDELQKNVNAIKILIESSKEALENETITFDDLGITHLFVDEAHNFKNVPIETKMQGYLGISSGGSARCKDMMEKVRCIQRQNGGGGVVFATGTPISNSITDAFIMQTYLQNGELAMIDLQSFDDWVRMFAEPSTEFEIDVDTSNFRTATRLSKFHNLPELTTLLSSIADFHPVEESNSVPGIIDREDIVVKRSAEFEDYLKLISSRTDAIRSGSVPRTMDNMLLVTTDGRKAALDMRLVDPQATTLNTKAMACAEKVANIYFITMNEASTQLVFCDISTPKSSFNLYDEIKSRLMKLGVPASQIAFVHDYESTSDRAALFRSMRTGAIRVLIGSTFKIGIGVNIQNKLIAVHHLDVPWRPADMEQREGRMIRPGNENDRVSIYRYITEGSFDAYSWQLLETKQRFITALLSGSVEQRSMSEIDNTVLDYAEVKAIAIGDERIKERVEAANELSRLLMLQKEQAKMREEYSIELQSIPIKKERLLEHISSCEADITSYAAWKKAHPDEDVISLPNSEKKARIRYLNDLRQAVHDQVLSPTEKVLSEYRGFSIVVPANMPSNDAFLYIIGNARYRVQLGTSSRGYLVRVDNFLDNLDSYHKNIAEKLEKLNARESEMRTKLEEVKDYGSLIEETQIQIEALDKELGVEAA